MVGSEAMAAPEPEEHGLQLPPAPAIPGAQDFANVGSLVGEMMHNLGEFVVPRNPLILRSPAPALRPTAAAAGCRPRCNCSVRAPPLLANWANWEGGCVCWAIMVEEPRPDLCARVRSNVFALYAGSFKPA